MSTDSNGGKKHRAHFDTRPFDEFRAWVIIILILVYGSFGLVQLLKWALG